MTLGGVPGGQRDRLPPLPLNILGLTIAMNIYIYIYIYRYRYIYIYIYICIYAYMHIASRRRQAPPANFKDPQLASIDIF